MNSSIRLVLSAVLLASSAGPAISASGTDLSAPHLSVIPRTPDEAKRIEAITTPTNDFSAAESFETNPGGAATVRARANADAFSLSSANMPFERELDFKVGNGLFRKLWVSSPSSTLASDGLGPLYNARSCQLCHLKDGRGHPPEGPDDNAISMFLRVSVPAPDSEPMTAIETYLSAIGDAPERTRPEPTYGGQLQDFSVAGHAAEYRLGIQYTEIRIPLSGGDSASLRRPTYRADDLGYGPLAENAMLSPRVAPQMIGLGLIEAIPADDIMALADPEDSDKDGISGRTQIVWSNEFNRPMLGRFGLKAGAATVREQSAAAFNGDTGISNVLFDKGWGDCSPAQIDCQEAPDGRSGNDESLEIDSAGLDLVTFYARNLAVPARRNVDSAEVLRGKKVFYDSGCTSCHTPKFVTDRLEDQPEQSFQLIWPYSDFLLHDLGEGLADNRPEGRATGREWRTAPLWGIGLTETVSDHTYFLHDGRARSLLEAILWHGGEAEAAKQSVIDMPPTDRAALISYLESL